MNHLRTLACLALIGSPASLFAQDWRTILDASKDHPEGWQFVGAGELVREDGAWKTVPSPEGLGLFVYTKETLGDCQIRVVFKTEGADDNGGVYIRIAEPDHGQLTAKSAGSGEEDSEKELGPWWAVHHGFEVQVCEGADPAHRTGAIYSLAEAKPLPPLADDGWRTMLITLDGPKVAVSVDGKPVSEFDSSKPGVPPRKQWYEPKREPKRPEAGFLGLQTHDPGDVVYYKEVSVRPLPEGR